MVSFDDNVSRDEYEGVSPETKSICYYSKDEIMKFKSEDRAEKDEKKAARKQSEIEERKRREAMSEVEIKKMHHQQIADQKRALQEKSRKKEEEWKKQQEAAEAMERMMAEAMSSTMNRWQLERGGRH